MISNQPPRVTKDNGIKTFAFPFQKGRIGFPGMAKIGQSTFVSIVSLVLTARLERVMRPDLGVDVHRYNFENMTPIMQARLAADVTRTIELFIPQVSVISVLPTVKKGDTNEKSVLVLDFVYQIAGQPYEQQVLVPTTSMAA